MKHFLKDNSLSLAFLLLFLLCIGGQAVLGHMLETAGEAGRGSPPGIIHYIGGADFLEGVFGNWQAALLQLFTLVVFAVFLRQRGASHSRKCDDEEQEGAAKEQDLFRLGGSLLYRNSLSIALLVLFAGSFIAFFISDLRAQAGKQGAQAGLTAAGFFLSARFWFDVLETWQAEFFAMGTFLVLTIFLRQENSAESKPIWAADRDTGETNE